nr:neurofilament heavy polypeptide-like [Aegilops tauschii subsp. strangulata]
MAAKMPFVEEASQRNYKFAKDSEVKNKKSLRCNFNPGPTAPRADGTRDANPNVIGPFDNFDGFLSYIAAQRATVDQSADDADSDEAPAPPKPQKQKKTKASRPGAAPSASRVKPLATDPPASSMQSEDLSRVSKKTEKPKKMPIHSPGQALTPAAVLRNDNEAIDLSTIAHELALAQKIVEQKNKIDYEKAQFKKHMAKLSVTDVQNFKQMLHDLKEEFHKKRKEAKGSRERMKLSAQKCVQVHNEAEKCKALGRPGIDPKLDAKKKPTVAQAEASGREAPSIVFPASIIGTKPKAPRAASELKKTRADEAEARKRKNKNATDDAPQTKKRKTKSSKKDRATPIEPLVLEPISVARPASEHQERQIVIHEPAFTEAPEAEVLAIDPTTAEDIANVAPEVNAVPEANVAPEVTIAPETIVQLEAHVNADAPVPPPRPHTVELAFDRGQPVMTAKPLLACPVWKKPLTASEMLAFYIL